MQNTEIQKSAFSKDKTMNEYYSAVFKLGIILLISACMAATLTFTAMKFFGLYPTVKWLALILFDLMDTCFFCVGMYIVRTSYENGILKPGRLSLGKNFCAVTIVVQWIYCIFMIPSKVWWAFMFFFVMLITFYLDAKIVIRTASILFLATIAAWIVKGDLFLPDTKEFFIAEMIIRVLAVTLTFADMVVLIYFIVRFLVKPIGKFEESISQILSSIGETEKTLSSSGKDLQKATGDTTSSISEIFGSIDKVSAQIENQMTGVEETNNNVNAIIEKISSLEGMIEEHGKSVSQASAAVEQMIGNIGAVDSSVEKMAGSFGELLGDSKHGTERQEAVNQKIKEIESQSAMLQEANQAIENIASQTNLLAMNAAIEAAHAGEAGKGFSVVSDEIRKLSETSTEQSKVIGDQLKKIKDSIGGVVSDSELSKQAFVSLARRIESTDQLVRQIHSAMQEQQEGSRQIGDSLHSMNNSTLHVRDAAAEMTQESRSILDEMKRLQDTTGEMNAMIDEMTASANNIKSTGDALSDIVGQVNGVMEKMGAQVREFSV